MDYLLDCHAGTATKSCRVSWQIISLTGTEKRQGATEMKKKQPLFRRSGAMICACAVGVA